MKTKTLNVTNTNFEIRENSVSIKVSSEQKQILFVGCGEAIRLAQQGRKAFQETPYQHAVEAKLKHKEPKNKVFAELNAQIGILTNTTQKHDQDNLQEYPALQAHQKLLQNMGIKNEMNDFYADQFIILEKQPRIGATITSLFDRNTGIVETMKNVYAAQRHFLFGKS
jgi:hypothetical protein